MKVILFIMLSSIYSIGFAEQSALMQLKGSDYAVVIEAGREPTFEEKGVGEIYIGYVESVIKGDIDKNAIFFVAPEWYKSWVKSGSSQDSAQYLLLADMGTEFKGTILFGSNEFSLERLSEAPIEFYEQSYVSALEKMIIDRELHAKADVRAIVNVTYNDAGMRGDITVTSKSHQDILAQDALNVLPAFNNALKNNTITLNIAVKKETEKAKSVRTAKEIIDSWK